MTTKKSVVTKERFAKGLTYAEYVAQIEINKDRFAESYDTCKISDSDKTFFKRAALMPDGPANIIVIGEAWCPDVIRGLPATARLAEATGMDLRVFPRDTNLDIMNEFLRNGTDQSIPVMVFYTDDLTHLFHWIERPALADKERAQIEAEVKKEKPAATEQEVRQMTGERTRSRQAAWQQESIREWRMTLEEKLVI